MARGNPKHVVRVVVDPVATIESDGLIPPEDFVSYGTPYERVTLDYERGRRPEWIATYRRKAASSE